MTNLPSLWRSRPRFRRDVNLLLITIGLLAVSFFGIQMFLKTFYILRLGYGLVYLGLFNAASAVSYMALALPGGALGDRLGVTRTMRIGIVMTIAGMAMLPLAESVPPFARYYWPILSTMVVSGGYALFSINLVPALMGLTSDENRNSAYAMSSVLRSLGTFVGTPLAGLLPGLIAGMIGAGLDNPAPYRLALWLGPAIGLLALIPLLRIAEAEQIEQQAETPTLPGSFPVAPVGLLILFVCFSQAASATCHSFCTAFMDKELRLSTDMIGWITSAGQFASVFAPMLLPMLARRRGNGWTLMATSVGAAVSMVPLVLIPQWIAAAIGQFGTMALSAMRMPALQVYQMEMIERRWRGLAYGVVSAAMGLSFALVSISGGQIIERWGYTSLFVMGVTLSLVGAMIMWGTLKRPALKVAARGAVQ